MLSHPDEIFPGQVLRIPRASAPVHTVQPGETLGAIAKHWYGKYIPELNEVIEMGRHSDNKEANKLAGELEELLAKVQADDNHKWATGQEDAADKAEREKRAAEFKERYAK